MSQAKSFYFRHQRHILFGVLVVSSLLLFFWKLGCSAFVDYDEATYAEVIKEIVRSGHLGTLTYFGSNWFEKPPLYFWIAALSAKLFGLNEFALRLPSALAGIGTVLLVWGISMRLSKNDWIAFSSGLVLLTTSLFAYASREVRMDIPVTFFITLGFYCFIRGIGNSKWNVGVGIGAALGVLVKSVVGLLIVPVVLLYSFLNRSWAWLADQYFWLGTACSLVIALPWHLYESALFGHAFWDSYLLYHVVDRFQQNILGGNPPPMAYFTLLYRYVEPWSIILLVLAAALCASYAAGKDTYRKHMLVLSYLSIVALLFSVFSAAQTKLFNYLDPLLPFAALFIAAMVGYLYQRFDSLVYKKTVIGVFSLMICMGFLQTINLSFAVYSDPDNQKLAQEEKVAGVLIRSYPQSYIAYEYSLNNLSTLDFYAERQVKEFTNAPPAGDMLLVVPTPLMKISNVTQAYIGSTKIAYSGLYLTVIEYSHPLM